MRNSTYLGEWRVALSINRVIRSFHEVILYFNIELLCCTILAVFCWHILHCCSLFYIRRSYFGLPKEPFQFYTINNPNNTWFACYCSVIAWISQFSSLMFFVVVKWCMHLQRDGSIWWLINLPIRINHKFPFTIHCPLIDYFVIVRTVIYNTQLMSNWWKSWLGYYSKIRQDNSKLQFAYQLQW